MFSPPRPATVPVHDVEIEVPPVPVIVQVGVPPFLKCTLEPNAAVAVRAAATSTAKTIEIRRMLSPFNWIPKEIGTKVARVPRQGPIFRGVDYSPFKAHLPSRTTR